VVMRSAMHKLSNVGLFVLLAFASTLAACGGEERDAVGEGLMSGKSGGAGGTGNSAGNGAQAATAGTSPVITATGGAAGTGSGSGASAGFDPGDACASQSRQGQKPVVGLYFMVDISGSMKCPVPELDPPCERDPGEPYSSTTRWTHESGALRSFFNSNTTAGMWTGIGFFPRTQNGELLCDSDDYKTPTTAIAQLPTSSGAITAAMDAQRPGGYTPTVPSLRGALEHLEEWKVEHPEQTVAVVYATDGYPMGCGRGNNIEEAARIAGEAFEGALGIRTYVLALGPNLEDLDAIAEAGGTDAAFRVDTTQDVTAQLTDALASIRSDVTVECTYTIPDPPPGEELDYGRVNVRYTTSSGNAVDIGRDPSTTACTQGWQYSADGTQIQLCGDTCTMVQADPGARVDVLFGCATNVGEPVR
jgi:hypothetical protein